MSSHVLRLVTAGTDDTALLKEVISLRGKTDHQESFEGDCQLLSYATQLSDSQMTL